MKKKKSGIGGFFKEFGEAVVKGDLFVKLSLVWMGAGYIRRKQIIKGILMTLLEVAVIVLPLALPQSMYVILELWERFSRRRFSISQRCRMSSTIMTTRL